ncbi:MAG: hypothetical protein COA68_12250 [Oceanobacter sp.]|nr:MAG: hypothetical protein COA68_12250 [Oceanobacter sp.]
MSPLVILVPDHVHLVISWKRGTKTRFVLGLLSLYRFYVTIYGFSHLRIHFFQTAHVFAFYGITVVVLASMSVPQAPGTPVPPAPPVVQDVPPAPLPQLPLTPLAPAQVVAYRDALLSAFDEGIKLPVKVTYRVARVGALVMAGEWEVSEAEVYGVEMTGTVEEPSRVVLLYDRTLNDPISAQIELVEFPSPRTDYAVVEVLPFKSRPRTVKRARGDDAVPIVPQVQHQQYQATIFRRVGRSGGSTQGGETTFLTCAGIENPFTHTFRR